MKILITGDPHFWDRSILSRKDVSSKTSLEKLRFVSKTAQSKGVDAVIFPGRMR